MMQLAATKVAQRIGENIHVSDKIRFFVCPHDAKVTLSRQALCCGNPSSTFMAGEFGLQHPERIEFQQSLTVLLNDEKVACRRGRQHPGLTGHIAAGGRKLNRPLIGETARESLHTAIAEIGNPYTRSIFTGDVNRPLKLTVFSSQAANFAKEHAV
jgi:hypothetical protein